MPAAPSSTQQKALINEVAQVTQADSKTAAKLLAKHAWNSSAAINAYVPSLSLPPQFRDEDEEEDDEPNPLGALCKWYMGSALMLGRAHLNHQLDKLTPLTRFFNNPASNASNPSRKALDKIFDHYRKNPKESPNELDIEGTGQLLQDLGVDLEGIASLYFFEFTKSPALGVIPRDGFVTGQFLDAGADSLPKIKNYINASLPNNGGSPEQFKAVYNHTFSLLLEDRKKAIDLEQAEAFWQILCSDKEGVAWSAPNTDWLALWLEYLNEEWKKAINKDLWRQTLTFFLKAKQDESLSFWSEESSWPSVIDGFVEWTNKKRAQDSMQE